MNSNRHLFLILCISFCLTLWGCQAKDSAEPKIPETVYDIETIFSELSPKITFEDTMELVPDDYSDMLLSISPELYTDCILYMGSGATAEELLIFKTDDSEKSRQIADALKTHLEEQKSAFEGYDPEELKILGEGYIASSKTLVFYLVSQDTNGVKSYIDEYLK